MNAADQLRHELVQLQRGAGLANPTVMRRVGVLLRQGAGIADTDSESVGWVKLQTWLNRQVRVLSEADGELVCTALGLPGSVTSQPFLKERLAYLSAQADRDPRTIRRRLDAAFTKLAIKITSGATDSTFQWCVMRRRAGPQQIWRGGDGNWSREMCLGWIADNHADKDFELGRREIGPWTPDDQLA